MLSHLAKEEINLRAPPCCCCLCLPKLPVKMCVNFVKYNKNRTLKISFPDKTNSLPRDRAVMLRLGREGEKGPSTTTTHATMTTTTIHLAVPPKTIEATSVPGHHSYFRYQCWFFLLSRRNQQHRLFCFFRRYLVLMEVLVLQYSFLKPVLQYVTLVVLLDNRDYYAAVGVLGGQCKITQF